MTAAAASRYDVFLSHNSQNKPLVEQIANRLVAEFGLAFEQIFCVETTASPQGRGNPTGFGGPEPPSTEERSWMAVQERTLQNSDESQEHLL